jgi:phospho-N-acetylmuramoyl-pentapeptide-transferase
MHKIFTNSGLSLISSCLIWLMFGNYFIKKLSSNFLNGKREFLDQHLSKSKTPTMGGIFIIFSTTLTIICNMLWQKKFDQHSLMFVIFSLLYGLIGLVDDYYKLKQKKGIKAWQKALLQIICGIACAIIYVKITGDTSINLDAFSLEPIKNSLIFIIWFVLIFTATTNAVNITDGLDGLATTTILPILCFFSYIFAINQNLNTGNVNICCCSLIGSCLGFLWFNSYPAQIFMGDVGSLYLGASLAYLALTSKQEILFILVGGVLVIETLSTVLQVICFKMTKKRFFKMAPFHHHLELSGVNENKITIRFGIASVILSLLGFGIYIFN